MTIGPGLKISKASCYSGYWTPERVVGGCGGWLGGGGGWMGLITKHYFLNPRD